MTPESFKSAVTVLSAQTALTTFFVLAGVMLMVFAAPPIKWLAGGAGYSGNWLPTIAAGVLIVAYIVILMLPRVRLFFDLVSLPATIHFGVAGITLIWVLVQRAVWRARLFERFLDFDDSSLSAEQGSS